MLDAMMRQLRVFGIVTASVILARAQVGLEPQRDDLFMLQFRANIESSTETKAKCKPYCRRSTAAWKKKCKWENLECSNCAECPQAECKSYCMKHKMGWSKKCKWQNSECSGCSECQQVDGEHFQCKPYCAQHSGSWVAKCKWENLECAGCSECLQVLRRAFDQTLAASQVEDLNRREIERSQKNPCDGIDCDVNITKNVSSSELFAEIEFKAIENTMKALDRHRHEKNSNASDQGNFSNAEEVSEAYMDERTRREIDARNVGMAGQEEAEGDCKVWCKYEANSWVAKCHWNTGVCSACPQCKELPSKCESWCPFHAEHWSTKCRWTGGQCTGCDECQTPPFISVPDEHIHPACDPALEHVTLLGIFSSAQDCEDMVHVAAVLDVNVNYGIWRGDSTLECFTCMIHNSRFASDYTALPGAVSFVKQEQCQSWCAAATFTWEEKCGWESRWCSGCSECEAVGCTNAVCPPCAAWCEASDQPWDVKCGLPSTDCRGCSQCSKVVSAGVFTLYSESTGMHLAATGARSVIVLLNGTVALNDTRQHWRMMLNMSTGFYTAQNVHTGEYLTVNGGGEAASIARHDGSATQWIADLSGSRQRRAFTMLGAATGLYLAARGHSAMLIEASNVVPHVEWTLTPVKVATVTPTGAHESFRRKLGVHED